MKNWPEIRYEDIFNYFVLSLGVDGSTMRNYKSTEAYQYIHSGKVGQVLLYNFDDLVFMKADVLPSQSQADLHSAWVLTTSAGTIETAVTQRRSSGRTAQTGSNQNTKRSKGPRYTAELEDEYIRVSSLRQRHLTGPQLASSLNSTCCKIPV
ncbi:hypothetical protein ABVT39_016384 [Epinephelus coioides]